MEKAIPFFIPDIGDEEVSAATRVLRSGVLTNGPEPGLFEKEFVDYLEDPSLDAISVNSATAGLHLSLVSLGIKLGDDVIVPTLTFTTTAEVVERVGARPVFADSDPETFCIDPVSAQKKITPRTKAIIPVHHSGRPCDMNGILTLAHKYDLRVIEDAAHALPASHRGRKIGTLASDMTVFSFYGNKTMTTCDGGMIVTRDKEAARRCRQLRLHGVVRSAPEEIAQGCLYDIVESGFKYNMPDIAAAIGREQLKKLEAMAKKRAVLCEYYLQRLSALPLALPVVGAYDVHSWHLFIVRFCGEEASALRNKAIFIFQKNSLGFSIHYRPLHQQSHWQKTIKSSEQYPVADRFYETALSLPLFPAMKIEEAERVCACLEQVFQS